MQIIHIHPKYQDEKKQLESFISAFDTEGEYVTRGERNVIKSFDLKGEKINIKSFRIPNAFNSLVYKYFRKSKAKRSFEYAERLINSAIQTPFPIAYIEKHTVFGLKESYYISKHIDYDFDFRVLIHQPKFFEREKILQQFTDFTFKLHESNVNFLDHSPGNTLIVKKEEGTYDFYLIDLNRMRFESMGFEKRMENFRRLWISKTMVTIIAKRYAELSQKPNDEVYERMLYYSRKFQRKINSKKVRRRKRKA